MSDSTPGENEQKGNVLFDHERRIGAAEGDLKVVAGLVKNIETRVENEMVAMKTSFEELRKSVIDGNRETMSFLQGVVKHEQSIESAKLEFEQKMQNLKADMSKQEMELAAKHTREELERKEFERLQKIQTRELTISAMRKFALWATPAVTVIGVLLSEWIQATFTNLP